MNFSKLLHVFFIHKKYHGRMHHENNNLSKFFNDIIDCRQLIRWCNVFDGQICFVEANKKSNKYQINKQILRKKL
jgi:hypothetical protein